MARERLFDPAAGRLQEPAASLIRSTSQAKRATARMYRAWISQTPDADKRQALADLAEEEIKHARALDGLVGIVSLPPIPSPGAPIDDDPTGLDGRNPWPSAMMVAFSLDQAATACLAALSHTAHRNMQRVALSIVEDEAEHQGFIIGIFRELADTDPTIGPRLAAEMLAARDWVRQVFPRRESLAELVQARLLPPEAPKAHDSFLASLGDRIQDALGVLGT